VFNNGRRHRFLRRSRRGDPRRSLGATHPGAGRVDPRSPELAGHLVRSASRSRTAKRLRPAPRRSCPAPSILFC